jgi:ABC-type Fe3+ transport system substrate-binding protein
VEEQGGSVEAAQRFLLEIKAGAATNWDANRLWTELYDQYLPHQKKFDILGMAQHKVLNIPPLMVDPVHRHVVALSSNLHVLVYNKQLVPPEKVPSKWEDLLRPDFKGKKFAADIRPLGVAALVPAWGLEKTIDFARKIAAQQPSWGRGHSIVIASVLAGETPMFMGTNFGAVKRAQAKDRAKVLGYNFLDPVAGRLLLTDAVLAAARNPYAALLWLEFQASPEGQKLLDEHWPFGASVLLPDSIQARETKGQKVSLIDWNHYTKLDEYTSKIVEAYGFPKAEKR